MSKIKHENYRPEVDGLRAVAVVPVVLFHVGFESVSGGFLGVDIFFVISGYLITGILLGALQQDRLSLANFYERRARRILPALFVVTLCSVPVAFVLMPPDQFKSFAMSVGSVAVFVSNFFFWQEFDYFSTGVELLPMVHTWSLGVEEQYYIFFPLILMACYRYRRRITPWVLIALFSASLLLAQFGWHGDPMGKFYLLPFRVWELLLGSLGALIAIYGVRFHRGWADVVSALGLVMIFAALFLFTEETATPSIYTLLPCLGTFFVLVFANAQSAVGRILSATAFVWIGQLSYSIYLWHQPVFAFARLGGLDIDAPILILGLVLLVVFLAYLTQRFVEVPFRDMQFLNRAKIVALSVLCGGGMLAFGAYGNLKGFDNWFLDEQGAEFLANYKGRALVYPLYREDCNFYLEFDLPVSCLTSSNKSLPKTLIWGDSHAQGLAVGLRRRFGEKRFFAQLATSSCRPAISTEIPDNIESYPTNAKAFGPACRKANATANLLVEAGGLESIVFHVKTNVGSIAWDKLIQKAFANGVERVFVVGPMPQWNPSLPTVHAMRIGKLLPKPLWMHVRSSPFNNSKILRVLKSKKFEGQVVTMIPVDLLCESQEACQYLVPGMDPSGEDALFSFDYGHLSLSGSDYMAEILFDEYF